MAAKTKVVGRLEGPETSLFFNTCTHSIVHVCVVLPATSVAVSDEGGGAWRGGVYTSP